MLQIVLGAHDEAVGQLTSRGARVDKGGSSREMTQVTHRVVEGEGRGGGIVLGEAEPHRHAHPEVLRYFQRSLVGGTQQVTVDHGAHAGEADEVVTDGIKGRGEGVEVEEPPQSLVEVAVGDEFVDRAREAGMMEVSHPLGAGVTETVVGVAEHLLVQLLDGDSASNGVEGGVVLGIAQGHLDDGLVQGVGGDPVEQGDLHLGLQQGCPGNGVVEPAG